MKRLTFILMALAMMLGFTQCKKDQDTLNEVKTVRISLNVENSGNSGSRHEVLSNGKVNYQNGDVIYVGDGSHYIGTLTCASGTFSGEINEPTGSNPKLHFYFIGGVYGGSLEKGATPSFTVDISNQSTALPVLSYNSVDYTGEESYNCELQNQCALVELTLTGDGTTAAVGIGDRYTQATINFGSTPGIVPNTTTTGMVTTKSESATKKYAIILPQAAVAGSHIAIGHVGYTLDIPAINANDYAKLSNSSAVASNIVYLNYLTTNYEAANGQTLTGTLGVNKKISIADGATVTLDGVTINGTHDYSYTWAGLTCLGDATIILKDESVNSVVGFCYSYPGIYIPHGKTLTIQGETLGTGVLNATGAGYSAGIGAARESVDIYRSCGNIVIAGGVINATAGGERAAGIGCGGTTNPSTANPSTCGTINITGGTITATGTKWAPGIGSGFYATCGDITIANTVTRVTATKGDRSGYLATTFDCIGKGREGACGTVKFGNQTMYNGSSWTTTPTSGSTYGGLNLTISQTTYDADTWTLTPVAP